MFHGIIIFFNLFVRIVKDCKVIPSVNLTTQHKLLVRNAKIKRERRKRVVDDQLTIKWGSLTMASAIEMGRS